MNAASRTVRFVSAVLAVAVTAALVLTKVHFNDELTRLTTNHDAVVLPVVEIVVEQQPAHVASVPDTQRTN